jgi:hypothetical protein
MSGVWWKSERKASSSGALEPQLRPAGERVPEDDAMGSDSRNGRRKKGAGSGPTPSSGDARARAGSTKTQALLPSADAVLLLLFGLLRSGQIKLRRLDGWKDMPPARGLTRVEAA